MKKKVKHTFAIKKVSKTKNSKFRLNWKSIWEEFETWIDELENGTVECKECGVKLDEYYPDWEEQMDKIKEIVNEHIKKLLEKK